MRARWVAPIAGMVVLVAGWTVVPAAATSAAAPVIGSAADAARSADPARRACTIVGTGGPDVLRGGPGNDVICGLGGADRLFGGGGADVLRGGPGADRMRGGPGGDVLRGEGGSDTIRGGPGDDLLVGGGGADVLSGGEGSDTLTGGRGDDRVHGGRGDDRLQGGPGGDLLWALDAARFRDVLGCGTGARDRAFADDVDVVLGGCEQNSQNAAPVAVGDAAATVEDADLELPAAGAGSPLANDSDPDGDPLTLTGVAAAVGGTVQLAAGTIRFTPAANVCGPSAGRFDYTVTDGRASSTGRVTVAISCEADDPIATDDLAMVQEDAASTPLLVLANDTDPDGDALVITSVTQPGNGTVVITGGGSGLTYEPDAGYCNQPPGTTPDTFTYTLTPGGSTATVTVVVVCSDDAPTAVDDSTTVGEDAGAVAIDVLANDTDTDGGPKTIVSASDPANGTVVLTGGSPGAHTGLTYEPDANYCNDPPGTTPDTFTYTLNGGSTATVSIVVTCADDAVVAVADAATVGEDAGAGSIDVLANDTDTDGGPKTIVSASDPANGTVVLTGGTPGAHTGLTYEPDANYCNSPPGTSPDTFTYTVNGGSSATVSVTVTCVNDAPVNALPAGPVTVVVDAATPLTGISVADVDAGGQDVEVTLGVEHGALTVSDSVSGGLVAADLTGNGTATVVLTGPTAQVNATLADATGLEYQGDSAYTGPDTLTVTTDDLGHTGSGGPLTDADTLALTVSLPNARPVADAKSVSTAEDSPLVITLSATDADGDDPLSFTPATPAHGTLGAVGAVTCDHATPNTCSADVTYTPDAGYDGSDSFTYTASDGTSASDPATVSITVTAVNDAPSVAAVEAGALAYTENDPAAQVTATATVTDPDSADFDGGTLTVDYSAGGTADDRLAIANQGTGAGQVGVSGSSVTYGGTGIGVFADGAGTAPLVVTLDADATAAAVQALVRAVTYRNVSDAPATAARTVRFVVSDGDGGTSTPATRAIALTAVDDPPTLVGIEAGSLAYTENDPATAVSATLTSADVDGDLTGATVTLTGLATGDVLAFVDQAGITGSWNAGTGVLTLTGTASPASYQTALRSVTYRSTSEDPSPATRTVTFQVSDASTASSTVSRDVSVTPVNDAPVADPDPFGDALGNTRFVVGTTSTGPRLTVSGDVLTGDTDVDTPTGSLTAVAGTLTSTQCAGTCTGNVTMEADGQFTYDPKPGFTGSDTFTYTVTDNDTEAPANQTATGTVTITVVGPVVWYVDGDAATAGDGRSISPSKTLSALSTGGGLDSLDGAGDVIFVYDAAAAYAGGLVLESGQSLLGEPHSLDVDPAGPTGLQSDLVPAGGSNPVVVNAAGDGLTLAANNTVQGIDLGNASGTALIGSTVGTATMNTVTAGSIVNATAGGEAVDISGGTLAMAFTAVSATGGPQLIRLDNTRGTFTAAGGSLTSASGTDVVISGNDATDDVDFTYDGTISDDSGPLVAISDQTGGTKDFNGAIDDNPANGNGGGISIQSSSAAATTRFDGGLTLSTGSAKALDATGAGTLAVTDPGGVGSGLDNTIASTTGTALTVSGTTIASAGLTFRSVSANGAPNGIVLSNTGTAGGLTVAGDGGACAATADPCSGGTIQATTGDAVSLSSTRGVSLTRMKVVNNLGNGIRGSDVTNFGLTDSVVDNNADDAATDEAGLHFTNLGGTVDIVRVLVAHSTEDNARIVNTSATLAQLNVTDSRFQDTDTASPGNNGLLLQADGGSITADVLGSTFLRNRANGLQVVSNGTGSMNVEVDDSAGTQSTFDDNNIGVNIAHNSSGTFTYAVENLTVDGINVAPGTAGSASPININLGGAATTAMVGTVSGNTITNSDSVAGPGIRIIGNGTATSTVLVTNNTVSQVANYGIHVFARNGSNTINATVTNNNVFLSHALASEAVRVDSGATTGPPADTTHVCADIRGNTATTIPGFAGIRVRQRFLLPTFSLEGYAGSPTDTAAVASFLGSLNTSNPAPTADFGGGGFGTTASCPTP